MWGSLWSGLECLGVPLATPWDLSKRSLERHSQASDSSRHGSALGFRFQLTLEGQQSYGTWCSAIMSGFVVSRYWDAKTGTPSANGASILMEGACWNHLFSSLKILKIRRMRSLTGRCICQPIGWFATRVVKPDTTRKIGGNGRGRPKESRMARVQEKKGNSSGKGWGKGQRHFRLTTGQWETRGLWNQWFRNMKHEHAWTYNNFWMCEDSFTSCGQCALECKWCRSGRCL